MILIFLFDNQSKYCDMKMLCVERSVAHQPTDIITVQQYNTFNGYIKEDYVMTNPFCTGFFKRGVLCVAPLHAPIVERRNEERRRIWDLVVGAALSTDEGDFHLAAWHWKAGWHMDWSGAPDPEDMEGWTYVCPVPEPGSDQAITHPKDQLNDGN